MLGSHFWRHIFIVVIIITIVIVSIWAAGRGKDKVKKILNIEDGTSGPAVEVIVEEEEEKDTSSSLWALVFLLLLIPLGYLVLKYSSDGFKQRAGEIGSQIYSRVRGVAGASDPNASGSSSSSSNKVKIGDYSADKFTDDPAIQQQINSMWNVQSDSGKKKLLKLLNAAKKEGDIDEELQRWGGKGGFKGGAIDGEQAYDFFHYLSDKATVPYGEFKDQVNKERKRLGAVYRYFQDNTRNSSTDVVEETYAAKPWLEKK